MGSRSVTKGRNHSFASDYNSPAYSHTTTRLTGLYCINYIDFQFHISSPVRFIQGRGESAPGRAALLSTLFATGILVTIAAIGAATAGAGRLMGDVGSFGNVFVAVVFILVGMALLDIVPMAWTAPQPPGMNRGGALAAFVLGLVFGIALGPCTFAFMAPMLAVTFKVAGSSPWYGASLLAAYGVGHCLVIALAGSSAAWTQRVLDWNEGSVTGRRVKQVCGVLVVIAGFYMLYTAR